MKSPFFYVGNRESDINYEKNILMGAILLFGESKENYYIYSGTRPNQNQLNNDIIQFYKVSVLEVIDRYPNCWLIFYNQKLLNYLPEVVKQHTYLYNMPEILNVFSNKASVRIALSDIVDIPPYAELYTNEISYKNLKYLFPQYDEFVIQSENSGGGMGTFFVNRSNFSIVKKQLRADKRYLVSVYLKNAQSLNVHGLIKGDTYKIYDGSIQIIQRDGAFCHYIGADFAAFDMLSKEIKSKIYELSDKIAFRLQQKGYQGIFGIDFLKKDNVIYFLEINTRFQGSTYWLDCNRHQIGLPTLITDMLSQEINKEPFHHFQISGLLYYGKSEKLYDYYQRCRENKKIQLMSDGYSPNKNSNPFSYQFRISYSGRISYFDCEGKTRIFENLVIDDDFPDSIEKIKIYVLSKGVYIPEKTLAQLYIIKPGVFSSIDFKIDEVTHLNAPYGVCFSDLSPFVIDYIDGNFVLKYKQTFLYNIVIETTDNIIYSEKTFSGTPLQKIVYLSTDRVRLLIQGGCDLKSHGIGCKFCPVVPTIQKYSVEDVLDAFGQVNQFIRFRHIMIGGGTDLDVTSWDKIAEISKHIKQICDKEITLMSIPPLDANLMNMLKKAGIDDVSFNMEICNNKLARELMPYKGAFNRNEYLQRLKLAVKVWGAFNVRSILLVGIDSEKSLLQTVRVLCKNKIQPVLSVFRPLKTTETEYIVPLDAKTLFAIYKKAQEICRKYGTELGPKCKNCRNNTLSV